MANKKLFELETGTPATSDKIAYGKSGSSYKNITYGNFKALIIAALPPQPTLLTKVVNITNYDMERGNTDAEKYVSLGVARSKIRSCTVLIRSNDGGLYPLSMPAGNKEIKSFWWIRQESNYATNARVQIKSEGSNVNKSFFNQSAFNGNGTGGIRGYIYVTYEP